MIILEFKSYGKPLQYQAIDEAIRTVKFIRNSCIRLWMDNKGTGKYDLSKYCKILAKEFPFANELNSTARQAAAERAWLEVTVRIVEPCQPCSRSWGKPRQSLMVRSYRKTGSPCQPCSRSWGKPPRPRKSR